MTSKCSISPEGYWVDLFETKDAERRALLSLEEIESRNRDYIEAIRKLTEEEVYVLGVLAKQEAAVYWSANQEARQTNDPNEQCYVGTRARIIRGSLVMEWFRSRIFKKDGKKQVLSTSIKKGVGDSLPMSHFKKEPAWAQEVIGIVERRYTQIRRRSAALAKLKRALNEYERLTNDSYK